MRLALVFNHLDCFLSIQVHVCFEMLEMGGIYKYVGCGGCGIVIGWLCVDVCAIFQAGFCL